MSIRFLLRLAPLLLAVSLLSGCTILAYEGYEDYFATPAVANPLSCKLLKASAYAYQVNSTGPITDPQLGQLLGESGEGYGVVNSGAGMTDSNRDAAYVWHSSDEVIIVFRGTLPYPAGGGSGEAQEISLQDWLNDADYAAQTDPELGVVHKGFLDSFNNVWPGILRQIQAWKAAGKFSHGTSVYVTGHSKGGALARLAALDLKVDKILPVTEVDTFGAPRVGGPDFAARYQAAGLNDNRYENDDDLVPHMPLSKEELTLLPLLQQLLSLGGHQPGDYASVGQLRFIKQDGTLISPADANAESSLDQTRLAEFGQLFLSSPQDAGKTIVAAHSLGDLSKTDSSRYFQAVCGAPQKQ
ncbi:MAG: lipase family protein [Bacillota bacterium]